MDIPFLLGAACIRSGMNKSKVTYFGAILAALIIISGATIVPMLPYAEAATTTISTNTTQDLVINEGDTVIIESGVELSSNTVTNHGTIINHGSVFVGQNLTNTGMIVNNGTVTIQNEAFNDGGTIDTFGDLVFQGQGGVGFLNINGGKINIKEGGSLLFSRGGSYAPHDLINDEDSVIDNFGSATQVGYGGMSIHNNGTIYNECDAIFSISVSGNPVIDNCGVPPEEHTITVSSIDLSSNSIRGMWTTVRNIDGTLLKSGFTPLEFSGESGTAYKVTVASFDGRIFHHWQDDSSTSKSRTVNLTEDANLVAVYDAGDSLRGYTSLTYTGTEEQPDLTVNALSLDGSKSLHMWTIIDPQSSDGSETAYAIYVSNYKDRVFDHWEDGSTDRTRTLTIDEATTITAYYQTG